jgi:hypothetical protein
MALADFSGAVFGPIRHGFGSRVDQCLFVVVMEAYLHGTSTRKV